MNSPICRKIRFKRKVHSRRGKITLHVGFGHGCIADFCHFLFYSFSFYAWALEGATPTPTAAAVAEKQFESEER